MAATAAAAHWGPKGVPMAEIETQPTGASVEVYVAPRANAQQPADCGELMALMQRVTGESSELWGPSIVGYGRYRYTYESGRSGEMALVGFAFAEWGTR